MDHMGEIYSISYTAWAVHLLYLRAPPKEVIGRRLELLSKFESNVEKYDRYESYEMYKETLAIT